MSRGEKIMSNCKKVGKFLCEHVVETILLTGAGLMTLSGLNGIRQTNKNEKLKRKMVQNYSDDKMKDIQKLKDMGVDVHVDVKTEL